MPHSFNSTPSPQQGPLTVQPEPIKVMADGTIKQVNPFSGTEVWTVPGRGNRPLGITRPDPQPLTPSAHTSTCAFCSDNYLQTPPEKARVTIPSAQATATSSSKAAQTQPRITTHTPARDLFDSVADFRRVANLFEIVTFDYWKANYGFIPSPEITAWRNNYIGNPQGLEHVRKIVASKMSFSGLSAPEIEALTDEEIAELGWPFFAGGHDLIIGRRHFVDGATHDNQLASAGTLSVDEHRTLIRFTTEAITDLYGSNRYVPYVAAFQNWLKPAGASFDHLHKQLVAIDERGVQQSQEIAQLRHNPNMYNEWAVDYAGYHNLLIAENDHAVCFAGFGHRYPTLEIFSKSACGFPWEQSDEEHDAMADLIHACHAAAGPDIPCNEEWHHTPIDLDITMPWRVMIKWRVSTLAGFEGGTKIYLNTLSPQGLRDRMVSAMYELRDQGHIARNIRIATECLLPRNSLRYNPFLGL